MSIEMLGEKKVGARTVLTALVEIEDGCDVKVDFGSGFKQPPAMSGYVENEPSKQVWFREVGKKSAVVGVFDQEAGVWCGGSVTIEIAGLAGAARPK